MNDIDWEGKWEKANLSRSARLDITVDDYTAMLESPLNLHISVWQHRYRLINRNSLRNFNCIVACGWQVQTENNYGSQAALHDHLNSTSYLLVKDLTASPSEHCQEFEMISINKSELIFESRNLWRPRFHCSSTGWKMHILLISVKHFWNENSNQNSLREQNIKRCLWSLSVSQGFRWKFSINYRHAHTFLFRNIADSDIVITCWNPKFNLFWIFFWILVENWWPVLLCEVRNY